MNGLEGARKFLLRNGRLIYAWRNLSTLHDKEERLNIAFTVHLCRRCVGAQNSYTWAELL